MTLADFLNEVFGGSSFETVAENPPLTGLWSRRAKRILDGHTRIVVYTAQRDEAEDFFVQLKALLEQASGEDIILIEKTTVTILG